MRHRRSDASSSDLAARARAGDADAFTEIWQLYSPAVAGYFRAHGVAEPDDLTSEVFLGVFAKIRGFRGGSDELRTFVFSVAHHRWVDETRRRARRGHADEYDVQSDPRSVPSAEAEAIASLEAQRARALVEALPPDQREVMLLRFFGDLTIEQTASAVGKRTEAVKALQHRALARLRKILEQAVSL
ncbi:MAG TPA: sigma-70 family RNA polymerase sigma factor [Mycobacteriales bacterium]|nr:sigma-70 family RNA polymerase sigma factor [Mycobacteriales bacterium]